MLKKKNLVPVSKQIIKTIKSVLLQNSSVLNTELLSFIKYNMIEGCLIHIPYTLIFCLFNTLSAVDHGRLERSAYTTVNVLSLLMFIKKKEFTKDNMIFSGRWRW